MIKGLHHIAFRCRDSEETRAFYEEVLGLELVKALPIERTVTGRTTHALHTFYAMGDGSAVAFFEEPAQPFAFKDQRDFDLHLALEATPDAIARARSAALARGLEVRGPTDHGFVRSTYFRDPNGYVVELCERQPRRSEAGTGAKSEAHAVLARWRDSVAAPGA
ncbi:VOC family protein [Desertibaculum subflavum]|uniref:VOC family protein n=1 Tax=Desertibaculum subflavum TaxID=2268458 RepID=UPI000E671A43